ncbi:hypothetical protein J2X61_005178 [Bacillus sp. 3255]|nr:hypothetical protein [Bacillus sp. 3255]
MKFKASCLVKTTTTNSRMGVFLCCGGRLHHYVRTGNSLRFQMRYDMMVVIDKKNLNSHIVKGFHFC